jgi:hypothetical protein
MRPKFTIISDSKGLLSGESRDLVYYPVIEVNND